MATKGVMQVKFQRDINRFTDNDRGSRKRGLQRILDELPWSTSDPHESTELETLITSCLLPLLPPLFSDSVEKCRELSLHILSKTCDSLSSQHSISLLQAMGPLCLRLSDTPFPESTEELRLQIIVLLSKICARMSSSGLDLDASLLKSLLQTITLSLTDTFPAVKQESAQLLVSILPSVAPLIRMNSKLLVRNLVANVYHQHSKVRVDTLKALGGCLSVLEEDYSSVVRDQLHPLLLRLLTDHSAQVRLALVYVCETVLLAHINASAVEETTTNIDLTVTLLILMSDEAKEVSQRAELALATITSLWSRSDEGPQQRLPHEGEDIVDAEVELRRRLEDLSAPPMDIIPPLNTRISESPKGYLSRHVQQLITTLLEGVGGWTSGSRLLFLRGLERSCALLESEVTLVLHRLLPSLGSCLLEDDLPSRSAAEAVCHTLGRHISCSTTSNEVLPYIEGSIAGLDTALSRASGLRLAQHILEGHILRLDTGEEEPEIGEDLNCLIGNISHLLTHPALHEFREPVLRESCLLLTRSIRLLITEKRSILFQDDYQSDGIEFCVVTALVYLRGRVAGESYENIISETALKELTSAAEAWSSTKSVSTLLERYFERILHIACPELDVLSQECTAKGFSLRWEAGSVGKSVFEVLLRECPLAAWRSHKIILPVIRALTLPKVRPVQGSPEELALSYASQRGEESVVTSWEAEIRLQMLALLEELIRGGSQNWECGTYITAASKDIIEGIFLPNLVWRSGKVESTIRKVALAGCYGMLKAGATPTETLFAVAPSLVPLLTSALDDTYSDGSQSRFMACIGLSVMFERLRGSFGDQSVREIYPQLLKRLDDSDDTVRIAICGTLGAFFLAAKPAEFAGTPIDYSLDQLFIHLDDSNTDMQEAVAKVLIESASTVDRALVLRKAEQSKLSHRSPHLCDKVIAAVNARQ